MPDLAVTLLSSFVGAIVAFLGAVANNVFLTRSKIDESLRDARLKVYAPLWKKTGVVPQWPRAELKYSDLLQLSKDLRTWYFTEGGIYLSHEARAAYGHLQQEISKLAPEAADAPVVGMHYDAVQKRASALRTELTTDLLSRKRGVVLHRG